jgi:hypothetical protein
MQPCTRRQEQANSNNECKIDALIGVNLSSGVRSSGR